MKEQFIMTWNNPESFAKNIEFLMNPWNNLQGQDMSVLYFRLEN